MTSLEIYEWMRKFICYYKNTVHSFILNPFVPIFIFKNDIQEKETITSNRYGWKFPAHGWSLGTAQDRKIPSAPVTGERLL